MSAIEFTEEQLEHRHFALAKVAPISKVLAEEIAVVVAAKHGMTVREMMGRSRLARFTRARAALYAELRSRGWSYPEIGRFANRDHTTVMIALCPRVLTAEQKLAAKVRFATR